MFRGYPNSSDETKICIGALVLVLSVAGLKYVEHRLQSRIYERTGQYAEDYSIKLCPPEFCAIYGKTNKYYFIGSRNKK